MENEERLCDCGECKYCDAFLASEDDYRTEEYLCYLCNGAGCTKCEKE